MPDSVVVWLAIAAVAVYLAGLALSIGGLASGHARLTVLGSVLRTGVTFGFLAVGGLVLLTMPLWIYGSPWWSYPLALLGLPPIVVSVVVLRAVVRLARRSWPRVGPEA